jgi:hypothetical protein
MASVPNKEITMNQAEQTRVAYDLLAVLPGVAITPPAPPKLSDLIRAGAMSGPQITGHLVQYMLREDVGPVPRQADIGTCAMGGAYLAATGGPPPASGPDGIPLITQAQVEAGLRATLGYNPYTVSVPVVGRSIPHSQPRKESKEWMTTATRAELERVSDYPHYATCLGAMVEQLNDLYELTRDEIALVVEHLGY